VAALLLVAEAGVLGKKAWVAGIVADIIVAVLVPVGLARALFFFSHLRRRGTSDTTAGLFNFKKKYRTS
jgi:hypothetical protein